MARGVKTSPDKVEEIKALSLIYNPYIISAKLQIPVRTIYEVLKREDNPVIEAKREERRIEAVDKAWDDTEGEIEFLKDKCKLILCAVDQGKVDKARLTELSTAYGTLFDKIRLMTDRSTQNVSVHSVVEDINRQMKILSEELDELEGGGE